MSPAPPSGPNPAVAPQGDSHVRLTVTDIGRSRTSDRRFCGTDPARDVTVASAPDPHDAAARTTPSGVTNGGVVEGPAFGGVIPSVQDSDDIDPKVVALLPA